MLAKRIDPCCTSHYHELKAKAATGGRNWPALKNYALGLSRKNHALGVAPKVLAATTVLDVKVLDYPCRSQRPVLGGAKLCSHPSATSTLMAQAQPNLRRLNWRTGLLLRTPDLKAAATQVNLNTLTKEEVAAEAGQNCYSMARC